MQLIKQVDSSRANIIAATILGGCIVLAAIIFASVSGNSVSIFSQWSMSNQLESQLKNATAGQVMVADTKCRLDGVALAEAKLRQDGDMLELVYVLSVYPLEKVPVGTIAQEGHVTGEGILNKQADGAYSGFVNAGDSSVKVTVH